MKFSASRETLLEPLQAVIGVVERRQTMPILANLLLVLKEQRMTVTATDLEVELVAAAAVDAGEGGEITLPGRKLVDICRALPEQATVTITVKGERATITSGRSRFSLATLPAAEFPSVDDIGEQASLSLKQGDARRLIEKTHFSMAQQDVRYYLNGLLLEVDGDVLRGVATDGHRLALCEVPLSKGGGNNQVIVPRKGVLELQRLLGGEGELSLGIGGNHVRAEIGDIRFTSKLIDGRFPEYSRVIPDAEGPAIHGDKGTLRQAMQRAAILSNEKYRGIRLDLGAQKLVIQAHNPEQEEAEEEVEVSYSGDALEIGFNVNYLLDALGAVDGDEVEIWLKDSNSSCLIGAPGDASCKYVVMPMRL